MIGYRGVPKIPLGFVGLIHAPDEISMISMIRITPMICGTRACLVQLSGKVLPCFILCEKQTALVNRGTTVSPGDKAPTIDMAKECHGLNLQTADHKYILTALQRCGHR